MRQPNNSTRCRGGRGARVPRRASDAERPAGLSPTQRLLEQIRQDGVGRDLRVEVMEKSGLRGNEVRDFNLLMEPVRRASAHLSQEGLEGRLRSVLGHGALAGHGRPCRCLYGSACCCS